VIPIPSALGASGGRARPAPTPKSGGGPELRPGVRGPVALQGAGGAAVRLYSATYACPHCGQPHVVAGGGPGVGMVIDHGPDRPATAAELWPKGDYPPSVTEKLKALRCCDAAGGYVEMADPERLTIHPPREAGHN